MPYFLIISLEVSRLPLCIHGVWLKTYFSIHFFQVYLPLFCTVLIEGVLFRARYLGSTQLISEGQPSKAMRMMQAQEAIGRIKVSYWPLYFILLYICVFILYFLSYKFVVTSIVRHETVICHNYGWYCYIRALFLPLFGLSCGVSFLAFHIFS